MSRFLFKKLLFDLGALDSLPERCSLLLLAPPFEGLPANAYLDSLHAKPRFLTSKNAKKR